MGIIIGIFALSVAVWQLILQRDEVRRSSRTNALIHIANLLKEKIEHHERIIEDLKAKKQDWAGHASRVNNELRPLLSKVNNSLVGCWSDYTDEINIHDLRQILKLNKE